MSGQENRKYKMKVILTGDYGVGKTTLAARFYSAENPCGMSSISDSYRRVLSVFEKDLEINDDIVTLRVMDTVGQERYRSLTSSFYRNVQCCFLVFDTANKSSMLNISTWYDDLQRNAYDFSTLTIILIGTTRDSNEREVTPEQCEKYAEYLGIPYLEINLDNTEQVTRMFQIIACSTLQKYKCRMLSPCVFRCCKLCVDRTVNISKIIMKIKGCKC